MTAHPRLTPSTQVLTTNALRHVAGAALVALSAVIVHRYGYRAQQWQYVAIAASLLPQVLTDLLALADADRRRKLRVSTGPGWLPGMFCLVLLAMAVVGWVTGSPTAPVAAALAGATGLGVAALPATVTPAPRDRTKTVPSTVQPSGRSVVQGADRA